LLKHLSNLPSCHPGSFHAYIWALPKTCHRSDAFSPALFVISRLHVRSRYKVNLLPWMHAFAKPKWQTIGDTNFFYLPYVLVTCQITRIVMWFLSNCWRCFACMRATMIAEFRHPAGALKVYVRSYSLKVLTFRVILSQIFKTLIKFLEKKMFRFIVPN
jgi:hypothetical protein